MPGHHEFCTLADQGRYGWVRDPVRPSLLPVPGHPERYFQFDREQSDFFLGMEFWGWADPKCETRGYGHAFLCQSGQLPGQHANYRRRWLLARNAIYTKCGRQWPQGLVLCVRYRCSSEYHRILYQYHERLW